MVDREVALIAAMGRNGVIGVDGGLPWRLPSDLKRFKAVTMGRPVIMGRKTHESIGRPLPGRQNIVVTRRTEYQAGSVIVAHSLGDALAIARSENPSGEIFVIGGGELYAEAMPMAGKLYITHVDAEPKGDTRFPDIDPAFWRPVMREKIPACPDDSAAMEFVVYERKT
jgi:dihydrofolate reductase